MMSEAEMTGIDRIDVDLMPPHARLRLWLMRSTLTPHTSLANHAFDCLLDPAQRGAAT